MGKYWERFHWSYIAAMETWTVWDWIAAEGYARLHLHHVGREDPTEAERAMAAGCWMAVREKEPRGG